MTTSAELQARRVAAVPRGIGNVTQIFAKRALNSEIWSEDGKRYIDFGAGIAVVNTGHQHPRLIKAIEEQLNGLQPRLLPGDALRELHHARRAA